MKQPYTYLEVEYIEKEYDEQTPLRVIAENVNHEFHAGHLARTERSISYVVSRLNQDEGWKENLETAWLNQTFQEAKP